MWRSKGKPITDEERVVSDPAKARKRTMDRAVRLLAAKPRAVRELRERLLEKRWTNEEIVDAVIDKLNEYGYLNDERYAAELAASKLRQKPQGERRLKYSLSQKKLDKEIVDNAVRTAFEKMPESDLIDTAIARRLRSKGKPETREDSKKFYDHLFRQGFSYDLIRDKMRAVAESEPEDNEPDQL